MIQIALETRSVTKIYESGGNVIKAVDDVSLKVEAGEFVALVGPSGSGKTTMLALLAGLLQPSQGEIFIAGEEMGQLSERVRTKFRRQNIGFVFQASNLVPYLTARENVELMLKLNGQLNRPGKARAQDILARLGLEDRLDNLPSQLSGGQRQRVAIARALIHAPTLVLADEPTASLDTERAYQVVRTFADLVHEQKRAGIMVTHDLRMCLHVDKIIQMRDGKLAKIVTAREEIKEMATSHE
ncbi:MAG: ABC transporter ATP-binding protein [Ardenticatenaceae bacterium]